MDSKVKLVHAPGTKERITVLRDLDAGATIGKVCKDYKISRSQVFRIKGKHKEIKDEDRMGTSGSGSGTGTESHP